MFTFLIQHSDVDKMLDKYTKFKVHTFYQKHLAST